MLQLVRLAAAVTASLLMCGLAAAQTGGNDSASGAAAPVGQRSGAQWTPESFAAARPAPKPMVDPDAVRAAGRNRAAIAGQAGSTAAEAIAPASAATERKTGNVNTMPLVFAGKIFFKKPDGNYVCSGQFISKRVVLTAAHCLRDDQTGDFYNDIVFALQYDKGRYAKAYDYDCAATLNGWVQEGEEKWTYDFGMFLVQEDSKTGWFGTHWSWEGAYDAATKIGYPGGVLDGQVMQVDSGPISIADGIVELRHGNKAEQGGSSGGAWIGDYSAARGNYNHIISVESFGYEGQPGVDYGPYFDGRLKILWDFVEKGCRQ